MHSKCIRVPIGSRKGGGTWEIMVPSNDTIDLRYAMLLCMLQNTSITHRTPSDLVVITRRFMPAGHNGMTLLLGLASASAEAPARDGTSGEISESHPGTRVPT